VEDGIPFVTASYLRSGRVDLFGWKRIRKEGADRLRIGFARQGDVLVSHKGTIGTVAVLGDLDGHPYFMLTPQVTHYRLRGDLRTADYLACWFEGAPFRNQTTFLAGVGATRAYLGIAAQRQQSVVVPPQAEQTRILSRIMPELARMGRLAARLTRSTKLLKEYRQALITTAVTGRIASTSERLRS
jgi:type I restriction enzyme S subunit